MSQPTMSNTVLLKRSKNLTISKFINSTKSWKKEKAPTKTQSWYIMPKEWQIDTRCVIDFSQSTRCERGKKKK